MTDMSDQGGGDFGRTLPEDLPDPSNEVLDRVPDPPPEVMRVDRGQLLESVRTFLAMPDDVENMIARELCETMSRHDREILLVRLVVLAQKLR